MRNDLNYVMELVKRGEDDQLDFKRHISNPAKIAKTLVAFANTKGGAILIGVDDQGEIRGVDISQERYMMIKAGKSYCLPQIYIYFHTLRVRDAELLLCEVQKSSEEHFAVSDEGQELPYTRVRDQTVLVAGYEDQLHADKHNLEPIPIWIEEKMPSLLRYLQDHGTISLKEYMQMMNISYSIGERSLLKLLHSGVIKEIQRENGVRYRLAD